MSKEEKKMQDVVEEATEEVTTPTEEEKEGQEEATAGQEDTVTEQEQEETEAEEEQGTPETDKNVKTKFRKKDKKEKKDKRDEQIEELTDRVKRQMAEFDNFRKRTEKEKSQMYEIGAKDIVEKILPVVDNFERGIMAVPEENKEDSFVQGMEKIYKQLMTVLGEAGVTPIEAIGKEFDPNFHNAVMHVEDENFKENEIAEVFQKGYKKGDKIIRYAMVKVAN